MASITTHEVYDNLTLKEVFSASLKKVLEDSLQGTRWASRITGFPNGEKFVMPSIGDTVAMNYRENEAVKYLPRDTGRWEFEITEYLQSGTSISKKAMQDAFYTQQLMASFVPDQHRAIMKHFETNLLATSERGLAANAAVKINDYNHRIVGGGGNAHLELADFAYAKLALDNANVPMSNLVAIVPPEVEYEINTLTNIVNVSDNPKWEGIIETSMNPTGMKFVKNIYGFDVYTSHYLPRITDTGLQDKEGNTVSTANQNAKASFFFSAAYDDILPWKYAWRQEPQLDTKYEMDFQEYRWVTTARYGTGLYRPENLVTIATSTKVLNQA